MVSKKLKLSLFLCVLLFSEALCAQIDFKDFSLVVVGNQTEMNNTTTLTVKDYFKGKNYKWPNKKNVVIALPSAKHPKVELYSNLLYNRSFFAVKKYWYSLVFQGRHDPPYFFDSDKELLEFVKSTPGAIAVVQSSNEVDDKLIIRIND
jgi:hypothetical protein